MTSLVEQLRINIA